MGEVWLSSPLHGISRVTLTLHNYGFTRELHSLEPRSWEGLLHQRGVRRSSCTNPFFKRPSLQLSPTWIITTVDRLRVHSIRHRSRMRSLLTSKYSGKNATKVCLRAATWFLFLPWADQSGTHRKESGRHKTSKTSGGAEDSGGGGARKLTTFEPGRSQGTGSPAIWQKAESS